MLNRDLLYIFMYKIPRKIEIISNCFKVTITWHALRHTQPPTHATRLFIYLFIYCCNSPWRTGGYVIKVQRTKVYVIRRAK